MLAVGDYAPTSSVPADTEVFSIAKQGGKKVVIFFFPRADTAGCTKEAEQFSALHDEFTAQNTVVIGISKDKPAKQAKFRAKYGLTCLLDADHETSFCEEFGVFVEKSTYGKTYMGIQSASFIIDSEGKIAATWPRVKVAGHAADALERLKVLQ
jgi:thioredoxin-dependent peroxiredoxin